MDRNSMGICLWESCVWPACQSLTWPRPLTPSFWHMFFCLMGIPFAHPWAMGAVSTISFICQSVGTEIHPESKIYFSHYGCHLKGWKGGQFKWQQHFLDLLAPGRPIWSVFCAQVTCATGAPVTHVTQPSTPNSWHMFFWVMGIPLGNGCSVFY